MLLCLIPSSAKDTNNKEKEVKIVYSPIPAAPRNLTIKIELKTPTNRVEILAPNVDKKSTKNFDFFIFSNRKLIKNRLNDTLHIFLLLSASKLTDFQIRYSSYLSHFGTCQQINQY